VGKNEGVRRNTFSVPSVTGSQADKLKKSSPLGRWADAFVSGQ